MSSTTKEDDFIKTARVSSAVLLAIHGGLLLFFFLQGVTFMAAFNVFSMFLYAFSFSLIAVRRIAVYLCLASAEVVVHLIAATICVGWECGFELYCFGLVSTIYYAKYPGIPPAMAKVLPHVTISLMGASFFFLRLYTYFIAPVYPLAESAEHVLFLINTVCVFLFVGEFLNRYLCGVLDNERDLRSQADKDELTSLYNRRKMHEILQELSARAEERHQSYTIAIMDIDNFKLINDRYGHEAGDYVLKTIAAIMVRICTEIPEANVCRWGGEEFLLAQLWDTQRDAEFSACTKTVQLIHDAVAQYHFEYQGTSMHITMTAGIAARENGEAMENTINHADQRLYWGKAHGKNRVVDAN